MAKIVGDIAVSVGADVSGLEAGMKRGGKALQDFDTRAGDVARGLVKVGAALTGFATLAVAGAARIASSANELQNLATIAGTSAEAFQRYAAATRTVGVGQEKLADIFKDVNDKFGEFIATGAGPLKDFFEQIAPQVGVTADQFARLSGPDALQLYVKSLEAAGASQQQMTFYMEALASDATALLPLLRNGGTEMRRLGDEAERSGRILSNDAVRGGAELDRQLTDLSDTIRAQLTSAVLENADEIKNLAVVFTDTILPALVAVADMAASVASAIADIAGAIGSAASQAQSFYERAQAWAKNAGLTAHSMFGEDESQWPDWLRALRGEAAMPRTPGSGLTLLRSGENLAFTPDDVLNGQTFGTPLMGAVLPPAGSPIASSGGGNRGGGSSGATADIEAFRATLATQAEELELWREEQLEKLREFRDAKLITEEEYNDLEAQVMRQHNEALAEVNRRAMEARLQAVSGALGDLSSLMQTENDKLFRIGQAAALAEAVVSGYSAAIAAWEKGMKIGGPPLAAAFTAASVAKTGALIAGIAGASPRGGGGGVSAGGGTPAALAGGAAPTPLMVRFDGMNPNDLYSGKMISSLLEKLQDEAGDRGMVLSFAQ